MSLSISDLCIEVTRRCNMWCCHCMRGEAENIDMDLKYVEKLFQHVKDIHTLTLSGGEPSLVPEILIKIIDLAKKHNVEIDSFFIVTNAMEVSDEFIRSLLEWYMFCSSENNYCNGVEISRDNYHNCINDENVNKLMAFRFVRERGVDSNYNHGKNLVWEGRTKENFAPCRKTTPETIEIEEEYNNINGMLYMDCKGSIHSDCDISYETMDNGAFSIGNIADEGFDFIKAIKNYNLKLEGCLV